MTSASSGTPFVLDGSIGEGGGQVLRASVALAALLRKPLTVISIRAGRSKPGLAAQHLAGLRLVAALAGGALKGGSIGSTQIEFAPGAAVGAQGRYEADPGTAGSITLLLQIALPVVLYPSSRAAPVALTLRGGTDTSHSPPWDFVTEVLCPTLARFGVEVDLRAERKGYYPKGGGIVHVQARPMEGPLRAVQLTERGDITRVRCIAFIAGSVPPHVADRMISAAEALLRSKLGKRVEIAKEVRRETRDSAFGDGTGITLIAESSAGCLLGASALGERGVRAEEVGQTAAQQLTEDLATGACVDQHLQDQLLVYMALAEGRSVIRTPPLTLHATTCIQVCELLTQAKFEVKQDPGAPTTFLVSCDGIGYRGPPEHFDK
eukprot:tig00001253_g7804.t1